VPRPAGGSSIAAERTVALGEAAPDFALPDLFDEQLRYTLSDYRGRPVILNFWASWCLPCRREMPALQATAARYEAAGLLLLGMNQTYIDDLDAARTFVEELGLTFPNTRDDSGAVGADVYKVTVIPTSVFVNAEGEVVHIQIGEMSLEQITAYSEGLIAGQPSLP
jgi:cytochrome c biogenesis protein CcmG, thiol:disulfide interchange protein DsbE